MENEVYFFIGELLQILEIKCIFKLVLEELDVIVLIMGEIGIGKEVVVCYLYVYGV